MICKFPKLFHEQIHNLVQSTLIFEYASQGVGRTHDLSRSGVVLFVVISKGIDSSQGDRSISQVPICFLQWFLDRIDYGDSLWVAATDFVGGDADEWPILWNTWLLATVMILLSLMVRVWTEH